MNYKRYVAHTDLGDFSVKTKCKNKFLIEENLSNKIYNIKGFKPKYIQLNEEYEIDVARAGRIVGYHTNRDYARHLAISVIMQISDEQLASGVSYYAKSYSHKGGRYALLAAIRLIAHDILRDSLNAKKADYRRMCDSELFNDFVKTLLKKRILSTIVSVSPNDKLVIKNKDLVSAIKSPLSYRGRMMK